MPGYVPGEQPPAGTRLIKLNTSENSYPPSPHVAEAVRELLAVLLRAFIGEGDVVSYPYPTYVL
jgi:histidinol-phosphate aminotransferase